MSSMSCRFWHIQRQRMAWPWNAQGHWKWCRSRSL